MRAAASHSAGFDVAELHARALANCLSSTAVTSFEPGFKVDAEDADVADAAVKLRAHLRSSNFEH